MTNAASRSLARKFDSLHANAVALASDGFQTLNATTTITTTNSTDTTE